MEILSSNLALYKVIFTGRYTVDKLLTPAVGHRHLLMHTFWFQPVLDQDLLDSTTTAMPIAVCA